MLDTPKPASVCLSLAVALVLALCAALSTIASCGSATADIPQTISPSPPDDSPADLMPTPTALRPTPTNDAKATIPAREEAAAPSGVWADDDDLVLELGDTGVYTLSRGVRWTDTGTWSLQEDGSLALAGQSYVAVPHGNLLLLDRMDAVFTLRILQRVDDDGNLLAYEPASAVEIPPIDSSDVLRITISDDWTGLSPLAPIEAYFRLEPSMGGFSGKAELSVSAYTSAITRSVPISVPLAVIEELLALLESTPLEVGKYKRVFNHTDDFPSITIAIASRDGDIGFASESQGNGHIPWRVVVGEDHYVTYLDTPAKVLDLLDPYLAREVQEDLFNLALARDP
jgi:hypothetical protein